MGEPIGNGPAGRHGSRSVEPVRRRVVAFAAGQGGAISGRQLRDRLGVSASTVARMRVRGDLSSLYPAVYAVGRPDLTPYGRAWAAILATRGRGPVPNTRALGRWSAAALLGAAAPPTRPTVLVVGTELEIPGIDVVRVRALPAEEVLLDRHRLPVTCWWRTMLDLPAVATSRGLEDVLARSERAKVLDIVGVLTALDGGRGHGRRGISRLRRALEPYTEFGEAEYRSLLERLTHLLVRRHGLPEPGINAPVLLGSGVLVHVDLLFADLGIAVEVDGRASHDRAREFELDRERDREMLKLGIVTLRFVWWDVKRRPEIVPREVLAVAAGRADREPSRRAA